MKNYCCICKKILKICNYEYEYFFNKANVTAMGLGYKVINGFETSMPCITFFVTKKVLINDLSTQNLIPQFYKGIITDVIESGTITFSGLTQRIRPALGGYSIGPVGGKTSGTLGCVVTDGSHNYILSNNHVLTLINKLPLGTHIIQPGPSDGGKDHRDIIASLYKFIPLVPSTETVTYDNFVDCAMAKIIDPSLVSLDIAFVGAVKGSRNVRVGEKVKKVGKTTELTTGKVKAIGIATKFTFEGEKFILKDQIATSKMSSGGDSGSVLLDANNYVVALLNSSSTSHSMFNPITTVLRKLGVNVVIH